MAQFIQFPAKFVTSDIGETKRKFSTWLKEQKKAVVTKHSHKSALVGTLFTFWPHDLLGIFKNLMYKHKLEAWVSAEP